MGAPGRREKRERSTGGKYRDGMAATPDAVRTPDESEPAWKDRAVSRSLHAARSRAEQRAQRFLDAAFALMDEKGTIEFTIQEVIDRSKQSLRGFYQYFDGKDELLLALFEETIRESYDDIRAVVEAAIEPLERLHVLVVRLHEWCEPIEQPRRRGAHNRRPISEFSVQLAISHPDRVRAAMVPLSTMVRELVEQANAAKAIKVADPRHATTLILQTVMHSWIGNRLAGNPRQRVSAEETWEFCLHGLQG
jgi:AcrR family transcriptional regulator